MACFPIGAIISVFFGGKYLNDIGRKNTVLIGVVTMATSTTLFGLASFFQNSLVYYCISFCARFLQGVAARIMILICNQIIVHEFPSTKA
jgi:MFS family permease